MQATKDVPTRSIHAVRLPSHVEEEISSVDACVKPLAVLMRLWCISQAGAAEKDVPLYKHLADLAGNAKLVDHSPHSC